MSGEVDFEEVDSGNSSAPEQAEQVTDAEEILYQAEEEVHVYLVFQSDCSIEKGISILEEQVLSGNELRVQRRDETENAVVAVMTYKQEQMAEELSEVETIQIMEETNLTSDTTFAKGTEEVGETETMTETADTISSVGQSISFGGAERVVVIVVICIIILAVHLQKKFK